MSFEVQKKLKQCSKCGEEKELHSFTKKKESKDGFHSQCKNCKNIIKKIWYTKNKIQINKKLITYKKKNINKVKIWNKRWEDKNKDKRALYNKRYKKNNKHYVAKMDVLYKRKCRENISDGYIKQYFLDIKKDEYYNDKEFYDKLIKNHRNRIKIIRLIKGIENGKT